MSLIFCCAALPLCFPFFGMGSNITKTDVHSMTLTTPLMLSPTPNSSTSNPLTLSSVFDYYTLIYLRSLSGCFFGAIKFLVTFAIFADLNTRFLQAISIEHIFAKIATEICSQVLLQFAILVEFTFLTVHLIFFLPKLLQKQFATKLLRQHSILDISGEPQDSIRQLFQPF